MVGIPIEAAASKTADFPYSQELSAGESKVDRRRRAHQNVVDRYMRSVVDFDRAVGRIVRALDELEMRHNTLLVVTSDQGFVDLCFALVAFTRLFSSSILLSNLLIYS